MRSATRSAGWSAMPRPRGTGPEVTVPGGPPRTARPAGGITLGVEEEFVLLDPSTGAAVLAGPVLARMLDGEPGVQQEVMRFQVETATQVCTSLDGLSRDLIRLRRLAAGAAVSAGCLGDRAVPRAGAGRPAGPAAIPGASAAVRPAGGRDGRRLRVPRARRGSFPRPRCPGAGAAAALARAAAGDHRQLADRGRPRHGLPRAQRPGRRADDHRAAPPARPAGDRGRPPAGTVRQRCFPARVCPGARPRDAISHHVIGSVATAWPPVRKPGALSRAPAPHSPHGLKARRG